MTSKKYVYFFGEGKKEMKKLLGGKGANLIRDDQYRSSGTTRFYYFH